MKQINLLRQSAKTKPSWFEKIPYRFHGMPGFFLTIFAFILIGFEIAFLATFYNNLAREMRASEKYLSDLGSQQTSLQREIIKIKSQRKIKPEAMVLERLKEDNQTLLKILEAISSSLPDKAWLHALSQKENKMILQGFALNHHIISRFLKELENSKFFETVKIVKIEQLSQKEGLLKKFTIACNYSR